MLEKHATSTLDSAQRVKRVIERTDPRHVRVNIDPANFVADLATAFDPTPMVNELFDVLGEHCATVHVKDYDLEDRFIVHISEAIPGTGMMDLDTVLRRTAALGPDSYAIVEHLPAGPDRPGQAPPDGTGRRARHRGPLTRDGRLAAAVRRRRASGQPLDSAARDRLPCPQPRPPATPGRDEWGSR